jgi:A/G-specific adenine glycosylase
VSDSLAIKARFFRTHLRKWIPGRLRQFPWRRTTDPYSILMAELMLRRTRAAQVTPVLERFLDRYPDVATLANAEASEVESIVQPLGLRWRVPAFIAVAQRVKAEFVGSVPQERASLLSLHGVGPYVADAVRCFAFGEPVAIVDTNTARVAGRYFGLPVTPESRRNRKVIEAVTMLMDPARPRISNLGMLDFAATVCRATRPDCDACPVAAQCSWYKTQRAVLDPHTGSRPGPSSRTRKTHTPAAEHGLSGVRPR